MMTSSEFWNQLEFLANLAHLSYDELDVLTAINSRTVHNLVEALVMGRTKRHFTRREFVTHAGIAAALVASPNRASSRQNQGPETRRPPSFILFLTDDQRWDAMGCMGNPIVQTPNMDRLASEGVLFTNNFCTTSICMSSRASIFTGMYTRRHGINSFDQPLPAHLLAQTYPTLLRREGYKTGFVGKWGLGGPLPEGEFDYFEGFSGQGQYSQTVNGKTVHLTRLLTEKAITFLRSCSSRQPFCLSVSFKAPHVQDGHPKPFRYDPAFEELYQDVNIPVPKTAHSGSFAALPEFTRQSEGRTRWQTRFSSPELFQESVKGYYRLITGVDVAIGKIMALLVELGLDATTVILHTSDNGFFLGEHGLAGKWLMYEESIRTPLIIRDPRLPVLMRGRTCEDMTLNIDVAPTLFDLAGVAIRPPVQGRSLCPLLKGAPVPWREDWFYEHLYGHEGKIPRSEGVRTKRWKYIRYLDRDPPYEELYDLKRDPYEEDNVVAVKENKSVVGCLRRRWQECREGLK
jgi:arylsulfatase A-like enzyme